MIGMMCSLQNSVDLLRFVTCVEAAFVFCVAGAILQPFRPVVGAARCAAAFCNFVAGAAFCDVAKMLFC